MTINRPFLGTRGKTSRPEFSNIYLRTRLFELFEKALENPILWLNAPGGFGKTVAVSSYLAAREITVLWYGVDNRDEDPAHFFLSLGNAAQPLAVEVTQPLPLLTPEYLPSLGIFARNYFEALFQRLPKPGILVLDNYQEVSPAAALHEILKNAGELVPPGFNIIVLSREGPPAVFSRLQAHGDLTVIGWHQFKLNLEEAQGIAGSRLENAVSVQIVRECLDRAQGWTAGVVLLLDYLTAETAVSGNLKMPQPDLLFNYFISDIFGRLPAATQSMLMQVALLPRITASLAEGLTRSKDVKLILADLHKHSFFITLREEREDEEGRYEFHPLFHEFLIRRAEQVFGADEIKRLQQNAAALLCEGGFPEEAVPLYLNARDWGSVSALIQTLGQLLLLQGRHQTLALWLSAVPEPVLRQDAWLLYYGGYAHLQFQPEKARHHYIMAFSLFEQQDDPTGLYLSWCAVIDSFIIGWNDFTGLDPWLERFAELNKRHPAYPSVEVELRVHSMLLALLHARPQHGSLPAWAESAHRLLIAGDYGMPGIYLAGALTQYYNWTGDFQRSESVIKLANARLVFHADIPVITTYLLFHQAMYQWSVGNGQDSIVLIHEGLKRAEATGIHLWDFHLCTQGLMACLTLGDLDQAQHLLDRSRHALQQERKTDTSVYHFMAGWVKASYQEWPQAKEDFKLSLHFGRLSELLFGETYGRMGLIHALFELGEDQEAEAELEIIHRTLAEIKARPIQCEILLTQARRELKRGNQVEGLELLAQGLALCRECGGFVAGAYWGPDVIAPLYATALEAGIEAPLVREMIRRLGLSPVDPATAPELWPWPVRIHALGQFKIIINDKLLSWSGKTQRKPLELLKALISFGGRDVPEEKLCEAVWPEADGDAAHRDFTVGLHRLRRLLGNDKALKMENSRLSLEVNLVWLDCWCFESRLEQLNLSSRFTNSKQDSFHSAMALYLGEFLPDESAPWIMMARNRLRDKFCRAAGSYGKILEADNHYSDAILWYQKILDADPLTETITLRLMQCFERQGSYTEALTAYERCRQLFSSRLNSQLGAELEAVHRRLADSIKSAY